MREIGTRPFQLVTGRVWKGSAFGGARGRTDVRKMVDWYMDGKTAIDELITHKLPLDRINEAFDLMRSGASIRTGSSSEAFGPSRVRTRRSRSRAQLFASLTAMIEHALRGRERPIRAARLWTLRQNVVPVERAGLHHRA
jgi:hypothetical protein